MEYSEEAKRFFKGYFYVRFQERAGMKDEELAFSETMREWNELKARDTALVYKLEQEPDYKG